MNFKIYYPLLLLVCVVLFIYASNYKMSPPLYIIRQYNLQQEQENLTKLNNDEVYIFDSLLRVKNIRYNTQESDAIYDSLINAKITPEVKELLKLPISEYLKKAKKDSLVIINDNRGIEFIKKVQFSKSLDDLPEEFRKFTSTNSFDLVLYIQEKDIPFELPNEKIEQNKRYFITTLDYINYLVLNKLNELMTAEEIIDKGYLFDESKISIPENILYPYKDKRYWLIPIFLFLALLPLFSTLKDQEQITTELQIKNKQRQAAKIWLFLAIIMLLIVVAVPLFEIDIWSGGGAILFIGAFLFILSVILFFVYHSRAKKFDELLQGRNILAKWQYDPIFWERFADKYAAKHKELNKSNFIIVTALIIVIFGIFMIADTEVATTMGIIGISLILVLYFFAMYVPKISAHNLKKSPAISIISKDCILIGEQFHPLKSLGNRFERAQIITEDINLLEVVYSYQAKYGRAEQTVFIPVPESKLEEAKKIVEALESKE